MDPGAALFHDARFWRVDTVQPAHSQAAEGRLVLSPTTNEAKPAH
jgi:hypothetical protein